MQNKRNLIQEITKGIIKRNPIFVLCLGLCPVLAVSNLVENAVYMGAAFTFVMFFSNITVSMVRKIIPEKVRIPCYIVIIASFVTVAGLLMQWFIPGVYKKMSLFINLIVVNCIVLGRAEFFASKNNVVRSAADAVGMGIGFTGALFIIAVIREISGFGTFYGIKITPEAFKPITSMILAPGAFLTIGFLIALFNYIKLKKGNISE